MAISKTTKSALYSAVGVLGAYYLAKAVHFNEPILFIVAGSLATAILKQPGELKRIFG